MLHERHAEHAAVFAVLIVVIIVGRRWRRLATPSPGDSRSSQHFGHMIPGRTIRVGIIPVWIGRQFSAVHADLSTNFCD
jgi:hypothetical protein